MFDFQFLLDNLPLLLTGLALTLQISLVAILFSLGLGAIGGMIRAHRVKVVSPIINGYVELVRNTPLPVQLFFIYFGLPNVGLTFSGVTAATLALSMFGTAYAIENFRAAFEAVPREPVLAATALGLGSFDIMTRIEFPLGIRVGVRSIGNTVILILKDSSIVFLISVQELTYTAMNIAAISYRVVEVFVFLGVAYLGLVFFIAFLIRLYERHLRLEMTVA